MGRRLAIYDNRVQYFQQGIFSFLYSYGTKECVLNDTVMLPSIIPVTRSRRMKHAERVTLGGGGDKNSYRIFVGNNCSSR
jgi:hypothetical protein